MRTLTELFLFPWFLLCVSSGCTDDHPIDHTGDSSITDSDLTADADTGLDSTGDSSPDVGEPITPELAPLSLAKATRLGAYLRDLECGFGGAEPRPVAWSMVNVSCQDRAMVLEYGAATAASALDGAPPPMLDTALSAEHLEALAQNPSFDVATINIAGPLVTFQTLIDPQGEPLGAPPLTYYWPYHHGVVVNVEGELRVLDLSIGDAPIPIDDWTAGFVAPSVACYHTSDALHEEVWLYWLNAFSNFETPAQPAVLCAYTLTPLFTLRRDQTPTSSADFIATTPIAMATLLDSLVGTLADKYDVSLPEEDLPHITSTYSPGTVADVCAWSRMRFCDDLPD